MAYYFRLLRKTIHFLIIYYLVLFGGNTIHTKSVVATVMGQMYVCACLYIERHRYSS